MLIESISGVRGIVPTDINNDLVSARLSVSSLTAGRLSNSWS